MARSSAGTTRKRRSGRTTVNKYMERDFGALYNQYLSRVDSLKLADMMSDEALSNLRRWFDRGCNLIVEAHAGTLKNSPEDKEEYEREYLQYVNPSTRRV